MRLIRRLLAEQSGATSLIEMMVVLGILSLILATATETLILGQRQSGSTAIRLDNSAQARVAMEAVGKGLRTTVLPAQLLDASCSTCGADAAFISADKASVTFYGNLNNDNAVGPSRIRYELLDNATKRYGYLVETIWRPIAGANFTYSFCAIGAAGCTPQSTRTLAMGLPRPATSPQIFTYYGNAGQLITGLPLVAGSASLALVDSIDVTMSVRTSSAYKTPATSLVLRVALPNADSYIPAPTTSATP